MKINENYIFKNIEAEGKTVLIPINQEAVDMNKVITLNDSGVFIFKALQAGKEEKEIIHLLIKEYRIDKKLATKDVKKFILDLISLNVING